ncbi:hypothetical protein ENUP19_0248G0028 [Entamoeba nuttalli]|uniref:Thioredoxin domain-containing protein n=1 Tax=Entamoeba nuttalli TaxID=412467 RepID=A0ABQ0DR87_9EUKA
MSFVKFYAPWCSHCIALQPVFEALADEYKSKMSFIEINCVKYEEFCLDKGIRSFPELRMYQNGIKISEYEGPRDLTNLGRFIRGEKIGKPESRVLELTASNFSAVVDDETKNVVVKFYVPWCNICKSIQSKYERLIDIYKNEKDLIIAQMDCSEKQNKVICSGKFGIHGYPTITFFPKDFKYGKDFMYEHEVHVYVNRINKEFNYFRMEENGQLNKYAGRIPKIDKLLQQISNITQLKEVKEKIKQLDVHNNYMSILSKILTEGKGFVHERIESLKNKIQMTTGEEQDKAIIEYNVLEQFK